ncbi:MAG: nuclear transport factor 2 family protein [Bacteroidota bacterium]
MINRIKLSLAIVLFSFTLSAQTEVEQIQTTLTHYLYGTSYNDVERIDSAFYQDATLYLTGRDGFKLYTPSEYSAFFANREKGVFNGREGQILEISIEHDIASAKAEILIPALKRRYIDWFLLKKLDGRWLIISKTATYYPMNLEK